MRPRQQARSPTARCFRCWGRSFQAPAIGSRGNCAELDAIADTGVDGVVVVANCLDATQAGGSCFLDDLGWLLDRLPAGLPLGLYECPAPYRRLLSDDELRTCIKSGRFVVLKDVSCDVDTVKRRAALATGSPLVIVNAHAVSASAPSRARRVAPSASTSWRGSERSMS